MRELIQVQIGQCGNRIGSRFFEAIADEHHLDYKGNPTESIDSGLQVFFSEKSTNHYIPRAVLTDLEPGALDWVRCGPCGGLFQPYQYVYSQSGSGNNFARGRNAGLDLREEITDVLRLEAEACESLHGIQICHSLGGGTGSGLGDILIEALRELFPDEILEDISVFPSPTTSDIVTEPYNTCFGLRTLSQHCELCLVMDNEALHHICAHELPSPTYADLNYHIASLMSGITSFMRFPSFPSMNLRKLAVNLIVHPRLHFFVTSQLPPLLAEKSASALQISEFLKELLKVSNYMNTGNVEKMRTLTRALICRGPGSSLEIERLFAEAHGETELKYWIPNNLLTCISPKAPKGTNLAATLISNSRSIYGTFQQVRVRFLRMFKKRAFIHWYTQEGIEDTEFMSALEELSDIVDWYSFQEELFEE